MLNIMRKNASSLLIKIIFSIIVIVFVFWGVGSIQENRGNRVALVNGEAISVESYQHVYRNYYERLQQEYGDQLTREALEAMQLPRQIISSMVDQELLLQEAEKLDLQITDQELASAIQSIPDFQESGAFNDLRYEFLLANNNLTTESFEGSQRESMLSEKLSAMVTSAIKVTDGEVTDWYEWINSTVDLNYALVDPDSFENVEPTDEEVASFYETYQDNYRTEPKVKVRYLSFQPEDFLDSIQIGAEEIRDYYELNSSEFEKEKTVEARHILLSVDEDASAEIVEEKREKAEEILEMARGGRDFAELAKTYSEGTTRETGGLLGEFKKDDMVEAFSDAAFSMAAGEISEPVRTQFGWHLIKVEKVNEASVSSLEDVSEDIRKELASRAEKEFAFDAGDAAFDQALMDEDFEKTAKDLGVMLHSTDFFTASGPDNGISDPEVFASAAFKLTGTEISDLLNIGDNYYILQKTDELPSEIPGLAAVESQVKSDLIGKMQIEQAKEKAEELLASLKGSGDMAAAAAAFGIETQSSGFFKRSESIPGIGYETEMIQTAFSLSSDNNIAEKVFQGVGGYYVFQLKERKLPDTAELDTQKNAIKAQLISQKQQTIFQKWLDKVRSESEIIIEERYLD